MSKWSCEIIPDSENSGIHALIGEHDSIIFGCNTQNHIAKVSDFMAMQYPFEVIPIRAIHYWCQSSDRLTHAHQGQKQGDDLKLRPRLRWLLLAPGKPIAKKNAGSGTRVPAPCKTAASCRRMLQKPPLVAVRMICRMAATAKLVSAVFFKTYTMSRSPKLCLAPDLHSTSR